MLAYAIQRAATTGYVENTSSMAFAAFFEDKLKFPRISEEKDGETFIPAVFRKAWRHADNVDHLTMAVFDIDQSAGDDLISLEEVEDALIDIGLEHAVYTSFSNSIEIQRFRIVMPFDRPVFKEEYPSIMSAIVEDMDEFLDGRFSKVIDRCWKNEPSRCYYFFTVHPDRQNGSISFYNPGKELDATELKMRQSTYGQDYESAKPSANKARNAAGAGAAGRSKELNRIIGGMFGTATEQQIIERLMEFDAENHAGNEYFRDKKYSRHRQKPCESADEAALRACKIFVVSHLSWLRRKVAGKKATEAIIVNKKAESREPMPTHDAMIKIRSVKNKKTQKGADMATIECQVMSGDHAGRHFWHNVYGDGNNPTAIKISRELIVKIEETTKTKIENLKDLIRAEGKLVKARIKHKPGTNGYPAQNEIGAIYIN